ncbi:hypothetical protein BC943DRAFT_325592 [Umbelopsis sp. AD052]|nr:hypothetical protein BC943DRAFT_325592 [Umbelopsis sp. AD052]
MTFLLLTRTVVEVLNFLFSLFVLMALSIILAEPSVAEWKKMEMLVDDIFFYIFHLVHIPPYYNLLFALCQKIL